MFWVDRKHKHRIYRQIARLSSRRAFLWKIGLMQGWAPHPPGRFFLHSSYFARGLKNGIYLFWWEGRGVAVKGGSSWSFWFNCAPGGADQSLQVPRVSPQRKNRSTFWPKYAKINSPVKMKPSLSIPGLIALTQPIPRMNCWNKGNLERVHSFASSFRDHQKGWPRLEPSQELREREFYFQCIGLFQQKCWKHQQYFGLSSSPLGSLF